MDNNERNQSIRNLTLTALAKAGVKYVPAASSNRHVHLSRADVDALFGVGYQLRPQKALSQPGQYACEEKIKLVGPKGIITDVRVLGPERKETQVEFSVTDSYKLGIKPVVRMSGDLAGTPGIRLIGLVGAVEVTNGAIVAERHVHMSSEEAAAYGLKDGDAINLRKSGSRPTVFENVIVRTGKGHSLEVHLDTDEGNAAGVANGDLLEVIELNEIQIEKPPQATSIPKTAVIEKGTLVTEEMLSDYAKQGVKTIQLVKGAWITPLAKDKAWELGLTIEMVM